MLDLNVLHPFGLTALPDSGRDVRGQQLAKDMPTPGRATSRAGVNIPQFDADALSVEFPASSGTSRHATILQKPGGRADCTCQDFRTRQQAAGEPCKHLVALFYWLAQHHPQWVNLTAAPSQPPPAANGWPGAAISAAVGQAIGALGDLLGAMLLGGAEPLLLGPTGAGKTSAVHAVVEGLDMALEEGVGSESWTDADLIGSWTASREWAWGPIGRAFQRAREGERVLLFLDEITRFSPRATDVLLRAVQPLSASLARRRGLDIPAEIAFVYVVESPLLGRTEWAPADRLLWTLAGNTNVHPLDPALVRRFQVVRVELARAVLQPLPGKVRELVGTLWDGYEQGEIPLPLEYQALTRATNAVSMFRDFRDRVWALDPIAAEAVTRILAGNGMSLEHPTISNAMGGGR